MHGSFGALGEPWLTVAEWLVTLIFWAGLIALLVWAARKLLR
jgi:hypothetical protein